MSASCQRSPEVISIISLTMTECSQKSTSGSIRMIVASSKVYYVGDPDTFPRCTDPKEEEEYAVAVQESDPTVSLRKDISEMAVGLLRC